LSRDGIAIDSVSPNATLRGHNGTIRIIKFKHENGSPGNVLASAGAGDFKPRLWDVDRGGFKIMGHVTHDYHFA
jgi:WD40 repeat protein